MLGSIFKNVTSDKDINKARLKPKGQHHSYSSNMQPGELFEYLGRKTTCHAHSYCRTGIKTNEQYAGNLQSDTYYKALISSGHVTSKTTLSWKREERLQTLQLQHQGTRWKRSMRSSWIVLLPFDSCLHLFLLLFYFPCLAASHLFAPLYSSPFFSHISLCCWVFDHLFYQYTVILVYFLYFCP